MLACKHCHAQKKVWITKSHKLVYAWWTYSPTSPSGRGLNSVIASMFRSNLCWPLLCMVILAGVYIESAGCLFTHSWRYSILHWAINPVINNNCIFVLFYFFAVQNRHFIFSTLLTSHQCRPVIRFVSSTTSVSLCLHHSVTLVDAAPVCCLLCTSSIYLFS